MSYTWTAWVGDIRVIQMGATHFVPALLGPQLAAKWLLTGGLFDGAQAAEMGLVSCLCPLLPCCRHN